MPSVLPGYYTNGAPAFVCVAVLLVGTLLASMANDATRLPGLGHALKQGFTYLKSAQEDPCHGRLALSTGVKQWQHLRQEMWSEKTTACLDDELPGVRELYVRLKCDSQPSEGTLSVHPKYVPLSKARQDEWGSCIPAV